MKKTLHGKRYLRSRASVQVGRMKRAERKMERWTEGLNIFSNFMQNDFLPAWQKSIENMIGAFHCARLAAVPIVQEIVKQINDVPSHILWIRNDGLNDPNPPA